MRQSAAQCLWPNQIGGEEAVLSANPNHLIVRTAWVYSPFGRNFVKTMFEAAEERDELRVVADQRGSPTSALDLAGVLLDVAQGSQAEKGRPIIWLGRGMPAGLTSRPKS